MIFEITRPDGPHPLRLHGETTSKPKDPLVPNDEAIDTAPFCET